MNLSTIVLVRRYAKAFLAHAHDCFAERDYNALRAAAQFMREHKERFFFLALPNVRAQVKAEKLAECLVQFGLSSDITKLIALVCEHKRAILLHEIFNFMCVLYEQQHGRAHFMIMSSHALNNEALESIVSFLEQKTGKTVFYEYVINKKLIAGLRLQSDTALWEYSLAQKLRTLAEHALV